MQLLRTFCCILTGVGLAKSQYKYFVNNFHVNYPFAIKFTEIIWIMLIIVHTKNKHSSINICKVFTLDI